MTSTYIKSETASFAKEMRHRHAMVLKGIVSRVDFDSKTFTLQRIDSTHVIFWSADTDFIGIAPAVLHHAEVFVRGQVLTGGFIAESVAAGSSGHAERHHPALRN